MESNNKSVGIIIGIVVLVVVVAGAFWFMNMNEEETATNETTSQTSQTVEEQPPAPEAESDIVELAANTDSLSTLVSAVQAADLVATLQGEGPFTVLAPTNAAFEALPDGTLDSLLLPENKDQLAGILTYHVIAGEVMSSDLSDGQEVTTLQGAKLTVEINDDGVYFVDAKGGKAMVETADVKASNGVVHIINAVLLPQ